MNSIFRPPLGVAFTISLLTLFGLVLFVPGCGPDKPAASPSNDDDSAHQIEGPDKRTKSPGNPAHVSNSSEGDRSATHPAAGHAKSVHREKPGTRGSTNPIKPLPSKPQIVYRPSDTRPHHDDRKLAEAGILVYESKRLKLYTDIDPEIARLLPEYVDQAYDALVVYFGPLHPNRKATEFQATGYIMGDQLLFRRAGLLPAELAGFPHGLHRGAEFWMNDQKDDYYRRHLMIHEFTHCFMTIMPDWQAPLWYLEGMAELFGTHWRGADGKIRFRVLPHNKADFSGLGRLKMIQDAVAAGRLQSVQAVRAFGSRDLRKTETYAWSWALCHFFDAHPRYRKRFRELGQHTTGTQFQKALSEKFDRDFTLWRTEWSLFAANLTEGFDIERAAIDFRSGKPLAAGKAPALFQITADRGWQSSEVLVEKGHEYLVTAEGEFTLADDPKPWVSRPQGISIRYVNGHRLGTLLAAIHSHRGVVAGTETMLNVISIGSRKRFRAKVTGTLYFRVNDYWNQLRDNKGTVKVRVGRAVSDKSDR